MGSGRAGRAALHPGDRCGRGMGGLSPVVDGVGTHQQKSGAYSIMAAIWRPRRLLPRQPRDTGVQCDVGGSVLELGMARPVLAQLDYGRNWVVDPARYPRDADLPPGDRRGAGRSRAGRRGTKAPAEGSHPGRTRADGTNGSRLRIWRIYLHLWHQGRRSLTRLSPDRPIDRVVRVVLHDPVFGIPV